MTKLLSFTIITLLAVSTLNGQALQSCWAHLDKPFYLNGDAIGYQFFLPKEFTETDVCGQIILFDANGDPVGYDYWINEERSRACGSFQLTENLPTGWYYLSVRNWDKQRKTERVLVQTPFAVYNVNQPLRAEEVSQQEPGRIRQKVDIPEKELNISITTTPSAPKVGEEVRLTITVKNRRGRAVPAAEVSVSINDWSLLSGSLAMGMDNLYSSDSLRVITPENLSSKLYWQGKAAPNTTLVGGIAGQRATFPTDNAGRFCYVANNITAQQAFQWTTPTETVTQPVFSPQAGRLTLPQLFVSPAAFRMIELQRQLRLAYTTTATPMNDALLTTLYAAATPPSNLGLQENSVTNWVNKQTQQPSNPSLVWYSNLQTSAAGSITITYIQGTDRVAYRVDAVAQDDKGQRGREQLVYSVN